MRKLTSLSIPLLLAALLLGACSGGSDDVEPVDGTPTATGAGTEVPASTASPAITASPAATTATTDGGGSDGSGLLAAMAEQFASASFVTTYDVEGTTNGESMSGEWTWYQDGADRFRMDFEAEGTAGTMISADDELVICAEGACFSLPADGSSPVPNPGAALSDQIDEFQADAMTANVRVADSREIAGTEAQCFEFDDAASESSGTVCYSESGIPLLMDSETPDGNFRMEATSYEDSVSDEDFEPPYPVSTMPGS